MKNWTEKKEKQENLFRLAMCLCPPESRRIILLTDNTHLHYKQFNI
jgi:hypothetical protein